MIAPEITVITLTGTDLATLIASAVREAIGHGPQEERLLTIEEVAQRLQVHPQTVYQKKREIGFIKQGRTIRFRSQDLSAYLSNHVIK